MAYKVLTQEDQDEIMFQFLEAQERDQFCHTINLERYNKILADKAVNGAFRKRIEDLKGQTVSRLAEVEAIIKSSETQIPEKARLEAAKVRIQAKQNLKINGA